jgi:hypothetical protein
MMIAAKTVAKQNEPATIEAREPKRRGRPRSEAKAVVVEDADNGDCSNPD